MGLPFPHNATVVVLILRIGLPALGVCLGCAPRLAQAQEFCQSCEVQVGLGGTYHYWGTTGSLVLPVSLTWSDNRYELAAFRFTDQQVFPFARNTPRAACGRPIPRGIPLAPVAALRSRSRAGLLRLRVGGKVPVGCAECHALGLC